MVWYLNYSVYLVLQILQPFAYPNKTEVEIVAPEREIPGKIAMA